MFKRNTKSEIEALRGELKQVRQELNRYKSQVDVALATVASSKDVDKLSNKELVLAIFNAINPPTEGVYYVKESK